MNLKNSLLGLGSALILSLIVTVPAGAQSCSKRMGPYLNQFSAQNAANYARSRGYDVSGVWGEGGIVSAWSNRRYFFNIFYC